MYGSAEAEHADMPSQASCVDTATLHAAESTGPPSSAPEHHDIAKLAKSSYLQPQVLLLRASVGVLVDALAVPDEPYTHATMVVGIDLQHVQSEVKI